MINQIVEMYKTLGKRYETKWKNVDRALRHVIEVAWKRGLKDSIKEDFFRFRLLLGRKAACPKNLSPLFRIIWRFENIA